MNNLKRVLSLALASVMLIGMMAVSASAKTADFSDDAEITNNEAVDTMVALNVIGGYPDGTFKPEGKVTRAEVAKMIYVALNGGKDNSNLATKAVGTFSDVKSGSWAEGYIEWCYAKGIIAGMGDGTFQPDGNLTGTQLAKLMLVAIGYDAVAEKLQNNTDWALYTNSLASDKNFYEGLDDIDPSEAISRDDAALLIYNACNAQMVTYNDGLTMVDGQLAASHKAVNLVSGGQPVTILSAKYSLVEDEVYAYLTGASYDADDEEYTYTLTVTDTGYGEAIDGAIDLAVGHRTQKSADDYSALFGHKVKVLYKTANGVDTLYGLVDEGAVIAEGVLGKATDSTEALTFKFGGTTYKKDQNSYINVFKGDDASASKKNAFTFTAVDNDGNGQIDVVLINPFTLDKVTFVGTSSITTAANGAFKFEDADIYEGAAKNDLVKLVEADYTVDATPVITKLDESVTGDIDAINGGKIRIDGTWYTASGVILTDLATSTAVVGDNATLTLVNGYVANYKKNTTSAGLDDVLYVLNPSKAAGATSSKGTLGALAGDDVVVLFADGTQSTVKAARVDTYSSSGDDTVSANLTPSVPSAGLYTYEINDNGVYELKAVKQAHAAGADGDNKAGTLFVARSANQPSSTTFAKADQASAEDDDNALWDKTTVKLDSNLVADDAVIYIIQTTDGAAAFQGSEANYKGSKVITGKDLKAMADFGFNASYLHKTDATTGLDSIQVAFITTKSAIGTATTSTGYGYVTAGGYAQKDADGKWQVVFSVWNGEKEVELTDVSSGLSASSVGSATKYAAGNFVSYVNSTTEGQVTTVTSIGTEAAVKGYDGTNITFVTTAGSTTVTTIDLDKAVVIYVDTAEGEGVEGGSIALATEYASGKYTPNVKFVNSSGVTVLLVDVNNKLAGATYTIAAPTAYSTPTVGGISAIANNSTATTATAGSSVVVKFTTTGNVASGKVVTVTATLTLDDATTMTAKVALDDTSTAGDYQTAAFTMPAQNITGIVFSMTVADAE